MGNCCSPGCRLSMMSMMVSWCLFVLFFFPRGVLDGILNLIESVSEGFPSYFNTTFQLFIRTSKHSQSVSNITYSLSFIRTSKHSQSVSNITYSLSLISNRSVMYIRTSKHSQSVSNITYSLSLISNRSVMCAHYETSIK